MLGSIKSSRPDAVLPRTNITAEEVARIAGVSPSTVSRVLNGSAQVSESKRRAVEDAIAKLSFEPSPLAQGLAMGRTKTIGVITQAISSPFYGEALRGIEEQLGALGYMPLFASGHWTNEDNVKCIALLQKRRVDGLIILTSGLSDQEVIKHSHRSPIVITGHETTGKHVYSLNLDNVEGARLATRHLLSLGHTRIACLAGPADHFDARERIRGYQAALTERGLPLDPQLVVSGNFSAVGGMLAMNQLLDSQVEFTALFACNDQSAYGASLALYRRGLRVPDDISLVGFDDLYDSRFTLPPLTSVNISIFEVGRSAAGAIVDMVEGRQPTAKTTSAELVVRESTARNRR
ncbi:MAG: LacI family DNA-binding transcriptional regulator [Betaproteobacteria bacterium]|nr:LacI family DNA-binding transcriptional regulator [Betaproteobacteria bacterium]